METVTSDPCFQIISVLAYSNGIPSSPPETLCAPGFDRLYLLPLHLERLLDAAKALNWTNVITELGSPDALSNLASKIDNHISAEYATSPTQSEDSYRIRIAFSSSGELHLISALFPAFSTKACVLFPQPLPHPTSLENSRTVIGDSHGPQFTTTLHVDTSGLFRPSVVTIHKTNYRVPYDEARTRVGINQRFFAEADVLLVNEEKDIVGCGFTTPYFWRLNNETGECCWVTPPAGLGGKMGVTRRWAVRWGGVREMKLKVEDLVDGEEVWLSSGVWGFTRAKVSVQ